MLWRRETGWPPDGRARSGPRYFAAPKFYRAEDYHQKYMLRNHRALMTVFNDLYGDGADFTDATAAARLNGYLGGHVTLPELEAELKKLDLTDALLAKLMALISQKR